MSHIAETQITEEIKGRSTQKTLKFKYSFMCWADLIYIPYDVDNFTEI